MAYYSVDNHIYHTHACNTHIHTILTGIFSVNWVRQLPLTLFLHLFWSCASSQDRSNLFISSPTPSHHVFLGHPLYLILSTSTIIILTVILFIIHTAVVQLQCSFCKLLYTITTLNLDTFTVKYNERFHTAISFAWHLLISFSQWEWNPIRLAYNLHQPGSPNSQCL